MKRAQLEQFLAEAEDEHTKAQAVYHKALKTKKNAEKAVRAACDTASETANTLAALKEALTKLPAGEAA